MPTQTRLASCLVAAAVLGLSVWAGGPRTLNAADPASETAVVIETRDGSRLVGWLPSGNLEFESEVLGRLLVPWVRVDELRRETDPPRLVMLTRSGDRSTGDLAAKELRLRTAFGGLVVPSAELLSVRPQRPVNSTGLRHLWAGEKDARDSVGEAHGEVSPAARFSPGRKGQAFTFRGQGEGVRFDGEVARLGKEDFTLAFWFRASRPPLIQYVVTKRTACQPVPAWEVRNEQGGQVGFVLATVQPEFKSLHFASRGIAADDTWHHVVITRSGRTVGIHLDGKLDAQEDTGFVFDVGNDAPLRLGTGVCAGQAGTTHFTGQLDELRVFNRALAAAEVEALYGADKSQ